ncbi:hypothetical protein [Cellulomonas cellasea]|uniref:Uncharacterized protein n=1 Tax=Cellulomonas cellasea TaxID=43670 RepID=A0A7W4YEB4_9CELL|nr:hypothetical protein [Cellulomonas cellasea]MBB2925492.1 hypothetical protein [Cellulomonas cellasea]
MTEDEPDYFLFVGSVDTESATNHIRASGAVYHKKLLKSKPENWAVTAAMITSPRCHGTLVALTGRDYVAMRRPEYEESARALLDALADRPHVILVHEAVFFTDEQRAAGSASPLGSNDDAETLDDEELRYYFRDIPSEVRTSVNTALRDRQLNVIPYRTNVERSIIASGFVEDNERHLLFRLYVPSGRLYAQEAEALLGLFREWLGQTGHSGVRQEGYTTAAGQVFEFFSAQGLPEGGLSRYFEDFSSFLEDCVIAPEAAAAQLTATGVAEDVATLIVSRFATRARRLTLDLKQRREERMLALKHELENIVLEVGSSEGRDLADLLDHLVPAPTAVGVFEGPKVDSRPSLTVVTNHNPQFVNQVSGSVVQSIAGTVNLGPEPKHLLELIATFGGNESVALETAVHELEDVGARAEERVAARGRLRRFLADLGSRGLGVGLDVLQKYVEHKVGIS